MEKKGTTLGSGRGVTAELGRLLAALPRLDAGAETLRSIPGNPPDMNALPPGCPFSPRCR